MPAQAPVSPPAAGLSHRERKEVLQRSKTALMRHAVIAAALALFFIGFNTAFTRELIWFPWPVAAVVVLWLGHLFKHTERVRSFSHGGNAWLETDKLNAVDYPHLAGATNARTRETEIEPAQAQFILDFGQPSRTRKREWLE